MRAAGFITQEDGDPLTSVTEYNDLEDSVVVKVSFLETDMPLSAAYGTG